MHQMLPRALGALFVTCWCPQVHAFALGQQPPEGCADTVSALGEDEDALQQNTAGSKWSDAVVVGTSIYGIPPHEGRVLKLDTSTDEVSLVGDPSLGVSTI